MFRALLCPSSEPRGYDVDYHIGRFVLGFAVCWRLGEVRLEWCLGCRLKHDLCFSLQPRH